MREGVQNHVFTIGDGVELTSTCSVGFAFFPFVWDRPEQISWEEVVRVADHAAYLAKRSGRNAWVGVSSTASLPAGDFRTELSALRDDARAGHIELTSSLHDEGREVCWGLDDH
jgi:hypothetical protein